MMCEITLGEIQKDTAENAPRTWWVDRNAAAHKRCFVLPTREIHFFKQWTTWCVDYTQIHEDRGQAKGRAWSMIRTLRCRQCVQSFSSSAKCCWWLCCWLVVVSISCPPPTSPSSPSHIHIIIIPTCIRLFLWSCAHLIFSIWHRKDLTSSQRNSTGVDLYCWMKARWCGSNPIHSVD